MIYIKNKCTCPVSVSINGTDAVIIPAWNCVTIDHPLQDYNTVTLKHLFESSSKGDHAHLVLVSTYTISQSSEVQLAVVREKIRFDLNGFYDRFFLSVRGAEIIEVHDEVSNIEGVRKGLKRHHRLNEIIYEPIFNLLMAPFAELGCSGLLYYAVLIILATVFNVWLYVLLVYAGLWIFSVLINLLTGKAVRFISQKAGLKDEPALSKLSTWTDPEWIARYYAQPDRKPFLGKIKN